MARFVDGSVFNAFLYIVVVVKLGFRVDMNPFSRCQASIDNLQVIRPSIVILSLTVKTFGGLSFSSPFSTE